MKRLLALIFLAVPSLARAEHFKAIPNQWTGRLQYVHNLSSTSAGELMDVSTTGATNGKALVYNSSTQKFEPQTVAGGGGGASSLEVIAGVVESSPTATIQFASPFVGSIPATSSVTVTIDSMTPTGVLINSSATATYLQQTNAAATYLTKSSATQTYLQLSSASATYLQQTNAANTYLTQSSATATYLQASSATATYLQSSSAAATYLQSSSAAATYLQNSSATATYLQQSSAAATYLTKSSASATYLQSVNLGILGGGTAGSNTYDFSGAAGLVIPNGTNPSLSSTGQIGWDTTAGELKAYDGTAIRTIARSTDSFSVGISSPISWNGLSLPIAEMPADRGFTINRITAQAMPAGTTLQYQIERRPYGSINSAGSTLFNVQESSAVGTGLRTSSFTSANTYSSDDNMVLTTPASSADVGGTTKIILKFDIFWTPQ